MNNPNPQNEYKQFVDKVLSEVARGVQLPEKYLFREIEISKSEREKIKAMRPRRVMYISPVKE